MSSEYALFFESGGPIVGNGFFASIGISGRLLAVQDEDGFELYGVNPGGVAVKGETLSEAYGLFVEAVRLVLVDITSDGREYNDFRREAENFFSVSGPAALRRWEQARLQARRGELEGDLGLRTEKGEPELGLEVSRIEQPSPSANAAPQEPALLAA